MQDNRDTVNKRQLSTSYTGFHLLMDLSGCSPAECNDDARMLSILTSAALHAGATVVNASRYRFGHASPPGCSAFVMLDESHISAHSYASDGLIAVDVFVCGPQSEDKVGSIRRYVLDAIKHSGIVEKTLPRFQVE